jgi:N-acetylglucosaminyl-diphospho-decaprenol L-rhamnosyltransferase
MAPASIDVVIPVYGGWEHTWRCLRQLAAQTIPHATVLVDNASPDDTVARARAEFPGVEIVEMGANTGFARAVNRGAATGSGEIVVVLNNDVYLEPDCLEQLAAAFDDPSAGSAVPLLLALDSARIDGFGITVDPTLAGFVRLHGRPAEAAEQTDAAPALIGAYGAAAAYRRGAFQEVGGLDERIFMYGEELDLALRLDVAGWRCVGVAATRGVHVGGATTGKGSVRQRELGGFARGYLLRRYGVLRTPLVVRALVTEAIVVLGDLVLARDAAALRGRLRGWRAARGLPRRPYPRTAPIGFAESLRLRVADRA